MECPFKEIFPVSFVKSNPRHPFIHSFNKYLLNPDYMAGWGYKHE